MRGWVWARARWRGGGGWLPTRSCGVPCELGGSGRGGGGVGGMGRAVRRHPQHAWRPHPIARRNRARGRGPCPPFTSPLARALRGPPCLQRGVWVGVGGCGVGAMQPNECQLALRQQQQQGQKGVGGQGARQGRGLRLPGARGGAAHVCGGGGGGKGGAPRPRWHLRASLVAPLEKGAGGGLGHVGRAPRPLPVIGASGGQARAPPPIHPPFHVSHLLGGHHAAAHHLRGVGG